MLCSLVCDDYFLHSISIIFTCPLTLHPSTSVLKWSHWISIGTSAESAQGKRTLGQWFSNLSAHWSHLENLKADWFLGSIPRDLDSLGLGHSLDFRSVKDSPGDPNRQAGLRITVPGHYSTHMGHSKFAFAASNIWACVSRPLPRAHLFSGVSSGLDPLAFPLVTGCPLFFFGFWTKPDFFPLSIDLLFSKLMDFIF